MSDAWHGFDGSRPIVLVTGGAKRVGRAICESFARSRVDVLLTHRTSVDEARACVRALRETGVDARTTRLDLADLSAVSAFAEEAATRLPRLDALIHNASIYGPSAPAATISDGERHYRVNALAPLALSLLLREPLSRGSLGGKATGGGGGGAIVAMVDMHAMGRPRKGFAPYSMSKAALIEMVRTLARDLAPDIRVNGVAPGVALFPEEGYESDEAMQRAYVSRVPLGRAGTPQEAAEVVRWLAMDAGYVTGEVVRVDGGRWLA